MPSHKPSLWARLSDLPQDVNWGLGALVRPQAVEPPKPPKPQDDWTCTTMQDCTKGLKPPPKKRFPWDRTAVKSGADDLAADFYKEFTATPKPNDPKLRFPVGTIARVTRDAQKLTRLGIPEDIAGQPALVVKDGFECYWETIFRKSSWSGTYQSCLEPL